MSRGLETEQNSSLWNSLSEEEKSVVVGLPLIADDHGEEISFLF